LLTVSADLPDPGLAVLRGPRRGGAAGADAPAATAPGPDRRTFLLLKYGRHGGGHGHPDKLGISLFSHGERMSPDLGTPGYGIALNDAWYRHTLSHNTVLLDGQSQPPATGRLLDFRPWSGSAAAAPAGSPFGVIDAEVDWPDEAGSYAGARVRRRILLRPDYFVDVCTVSCPRPRAIEWAYHHCGRLTHVGAGATPPPVPAALPPAGDHVAYAVPETLRLRAALPGRPAVTAAFTTGTAGLHLWLNGIAPDDPVGPGDQPSWVLAAEAPDSPAAEPVALLLRRRVGTSATFGAVFVPYDRHGPHDGRPGVGAVSWSQPAGQDVALTCQVTSRRGSERWDISLAGREPPRLQTIE
jgi:hypothetical protein